MPQNLTPFLLRVCRSVDALRRVILLLVLAALSAPAHGATPSSTRPYAVGEGDAAHTLRQFVEQSGEQVVYVVTKVRGVKTNPVRGQFTARDALNRLVAGTHLVVVEDQKTGALLVNFVAPENASPPKPKPEPANPTTSVKKSLTARLAGVLLALAGSPASAENAPAVSPATLARYDANKNGRLDPDELAALRADQPVPRVETTESSSSETIALSPFEVKSDNDGYYAANTTSSTRLNSSVEDLASSTSIVTKKQMTDFGLLDINDIFAYEASTEGTATFTDAALDRNGSTVDTTSTDPANANRVRGIGAANLSIGNFASNGLVPVDPINIDGVEVSRGPNSSVFGLGNPSGTVNLQPATANLSRNRSSITFRSDSYGGYRTSLDLNRVLWKNKLAIRGSAVYQHDGFVREPSGVDSVRLNAMLRYRPFKHTTFTGSYSTYRSYGTLVNQTMPRETVSSWRAAGSPTWDPVTATAKINGTAVPGTWTTTSLPSYFSASQFLNLSTIFVQPDGRASWWGPSRTTTSTTTPVTPNQNVFLVNTVFTPPTPAQPLFATDPATNNRGLYDYTSINLAAMNYTAVRQATANLQLEQTIFNTPRNLLALQAGFFGENGVRQTNDMMGAAGSGGRTAYIYVDVNERMVDGTPNPNLLRPFIGIFNIRARADNYSQRKTGRTQLAYRLDLRNEKNLLHWLGMHTLSAYAEERRTRTRLTRWQDEVGSSQSWYPFPATERTATTFTTPAVAAQPFYRYYVGDNQGQNVDYAPHALIPGVYNFSWGNGVTGVFNRDPAKIDGNYFFSQTTGWRSNTLRTLGAALQSSLINDRVITTVGFRKDRTVDRNPSPRQYTFGPDGYNLVASSLAILSPAAPTYRMGDTKTAGVVVKATSWLRFHANMSDSFLPATLNQVGLYLNPLPNPSGEGTDYGVSVTLLQGKLVARLNRYSTLQIQSRANNGGTLAQRVHGIDLTTNYAPPGLVNVARGWITRAATASGTVLSEDQINQQISGIAKLDQKYFVNPNFSNSLIYAPSDLESRGYEFELNYNPSRNWTIKGNVTQTESIDKNLSGDITNWIAERLPVWTSIIDPELNKPFFTERYGAAQSAKEFLDASVLAPLAVAQANEGKSQPQIRKYRANLLTRYQLAGITDHKWLRNVAVGGAVRWEDKGAIGYNGVLNTAGIYQSLDATRPIYDKARAYFDFLASYRTKLYKGRIEANFQLNIRNVQESGRLQAISALPNGAPSAYRIIDPRQFILSASFDL